LEGKSDEREEKKKRRNKRARENKADHKGNSPAGGVFRQVSKIFWKSGVWLADLKKKKWALVFFNFFFLPLSLPPL
jgi:hypothetical protein